MNAKEVLEILGDLDAIEIIGRLVYDELSSIYECGDPTSSRYKKLKELHELIREVKE